jgi:pyruvate/2-oxoglutarate dehydrogenase complex dihydrolipoamide acyltransferase (E2) component
VRSSPTETLVDVLLPAMGTSITEGTVIAWAKSVGDRVAADETICEVSTDKVDTECPSPASGVVAEILVGVGETVDVGSVIARLAVEDGAAVPALPPTPDSSPPDPPSAREPTSTTDRPSPPGPAPTSNGRRYSPVVVRMAQAHGLDLSQVAGTGQNGRVTKKDVQAHLEREPQERPLHSESPYRPDPEPVVATAVTADGLGGVAEPLSRMRQSIGTAMRRSQETAATCHTMVECDMSRVEARRRELGITALPLIARAVVETLRDFPELNATLDGTTITRYERAHVGIAVSLGADGLIVPVVRDAQDLSAEGWASRIKDLAGRARAKQLQPDEVQGATFTITNPGAAGAVFATPIINVPQVAILDLEAIVRRPVVVTDADGNESIAIRPMVNLILGWDHRALDGIYAAQFLTALRKRLESGR